MDNLDKNNDLENLFRKGLQDLNPAPDADTWTEIAARQKPRNAWLKIRHYSLYIAPAALLLAIAAGWWYFNQTLAATRPAPAPGLQQTRPPAGPVAALKNPVVVLPIPEPATRTATPASTRLNTVPAATVRFQAETGLEYQNPVTGTSVRIPANALVDAQGRPVRGEAELLLREYRSIADFLASGIPMHYADARGAFFFNSGGMFEVRVRQNGAQLSLAPGQTYNVTFSPTGQLTDASLYYFDEQRGTWTYRPDAAFGKQGAAMPAQPLVVAEPVAVSNNRSGADRFDCLPALPELETEENPASWVKDGVRMGYDLARGKTEMPVWFRKRPHMTNENLLNSLERGLIRIVRNRDLGELFFPEDLNNVFTELKAFKDCYFIRSADSVEQKKEIPADVYWDRISIRQELGNQCFISLYSEKEGLLQFYATLTASIGNKQFDANQVLADYRLIRGKRERDFEQLLTTLRRFLFVAPMFQAEAEWCMSDDEWLAYFEEQKPLMTKRYSELVQSGLHTDNALALSAWEKWRSQVREKYFDRGIPVRAWGRNNQTNLEYALQLTSFGIYNCDQIFRLGREPDYVYAAYQTAGGDRIEAASVSVLERQSRLYFTLPAPDKIIRVPGRGLDIVITGRDGRYYHLPAAEYRRMSMTMDGRQRSNTITVKDITDQTRTPRDWATYLDM
jgi:hypothetical protein